MASPETGLRRRRCASCASPPVTGRNATRAAQRGVAARRVSRSRKPASAPRRPTARPSPGIPRANAARGRPRRTRSPFHVALDRCCRAKAAVPAGADRCSRPLPVRRPCRRRGRWRRAHRKARSGRGDRDARGAADRRPPRRRHRHRRRGDRARRRARPRRPPSPAARHRDHAQRRSRGRVGRVHPRRQPRPDAGAGRRPARRLRVDRRDDAGGDPAGSDRAHRDPARAGVEPLRRRRDRRRDPDLHLRRVGDAAGDGECQRRQLRDPRAQRARRRQRRPAAAVAAGGSARERRLQRGVQSRCLQLQPGRRRLPQRQRDRRSRAAARRRARAGGQVSLQPAGRAVRRQRRIRRPHGHHPRDLAAREPQPAGAVLDVAADRRPEQRRQRIARPSTGTSRSAPGRRSRLAERLHAAAGLADRRLRIPQGNGQHRRRVRGDLARHELGVRDLSVARRRAGAPGQPALGRFDRSTAARRPGRWPTATGCCRRCA